MIDVQNEECSKYLDSLEPNAFHSCITDPPYELGFMGEDWDRSGIAFDPEFWSKVKRVLKPGAHMAVFGGSRTYHRIAVGIEDAGFEIRDSVDWVYGGGFAKSHDIGKAIDEHFGKKDEREPVGFKNNAAKKDGSMIERESYDGWRDNPGRWQERGRDPYERAPATEEAKKWEGWDTQLKPAKEPIVIARKPFDNTVAENVLKHSTGAMNIDDCRIDTEGESFHAPQSDPTNREGEVGTDLGFSENSVEKFQESQKASIERLREKGRWPANVILDPDMAKRLDEQSGIEASRYFKQIDPFFYCPKAKRSERDLGVENNDHVTVKPIELMSYLVRLLTPEGGRCLDPFAGSGTTGMSAVLEGVGATLVEMDSHYAEIANQRVQYAKDNYQRLRGRIYGDPSNNITNEQTEVNDHEFW
jgi:site-specific DNA-methyltransferase (adenine-specific)